MAFFKTGVKQAYARACFPKCSCRWRYLQEQQVAFYSQFYQLLQLCFGSIISNFFPPSPLQSPLVAQLKGSGKTLHALNHKKTTFLFLEGDGGGARTESRAKKKKKCDSSACWLSAVGARRPLLCSCAMKQIYRLPSGVSSGLDCGSECPVPGFVRSPPFSSSSSILCFKGCRSSDMQTATH